MMNQLLKNTTPYKVSLALLMDGHLDVIPMNPSHFVFEATGSHRATFKYNYYDFQKKIFELTDKEIFDLHKAFKSYYASTKDEYSYCDVNLVQDLIDYHLVLRSEDNFCLGTLRDIKSSFTQNLRLAKELGGVTDQILCELVDKIIEEYS